MFTFKILIVDDLIENLKTMNSIFEKYHPEYIMLQTNSAESALNILSQTKPDVIITDWDMQGMNGIEFIKTLKLDKDLKDIPVIMATGVNLSSENMKSALDAGAVDYIRKPFEPIELIARTQSILKISEYHKAMLMAKDEVLTESALYLIKSNRFNEDITRKLTSLDKKLETDNCDIHLSIKKIINEVNSRIKEDSWYHFNLSFNKVHKNFDKNLAAKFPSLTGNDLKLSSFIRLGMNNKDIASVLNLSPDSVKVSRSRLRKKLNLNQKQNLETFLAAF